MPNATLRANARAMPSVQRIAPTDKDFIDDLSYLPDRYGMVIHGDCLSPMAKSGATLIFDKTEPYAVGDLVILFRRREVVPDGQFQGMVKRLIMAPPFWAKLPFRDHPESDVVALVGFEMVNPFRRFTMRCSDLLGIHKCVGKASAKTKCVDADFPDACRTEGRR